MALAAQLLAVESTPDISSVPPDLQIPALSNDLPSAGKRVSYQLFENTPNVILYLPTDWTPNKKFPLIIELAGNGNYKNKYGDTSSGLPQDSKLGYGLSGGKGYIWVCLPFLNDARNEVAITWWGDPPKHRPDSNVAFIKRAVPALCDRFSGEPNRVILCGFSRGAIATNAIGLHDEEIAKLWRGFICFSHYDGVNTQWPFIGADTTSARQRLLRLKGRPQLICHESGSQKFNLQTTRNYLKSSGITGDFTFLESGFRNHNDAWLLRPSAARITARKWLEKVVLDSNEEF